MGIDPGVERLGYAIIETKGASPQVCGYGLVSTQKNTPTPQRLKILYDDLFLLVDRYTPDVLVMEQLFFARNVTTAMMVSAARGVVMLVAAQRGLEVREIAPSQLKRAVCGSGRATKSQIQRALQYLLGLSEIPAPDDVADALALALVGALSHPGKR